jgi:hypothetical protein
MNQMENYERQQLVAGSVVVEKISWGFLSFFLFFIFLFFKKKEKIKTQAFAYTKI